MLHRYPVTNAAYKAYLQNAFKFMFYERIVEVILTLLLGKTVKK